MIFAKLLRLRDKLTSKRQQLTEDTEKPFLEHLDDLRKMLMKITITMLITVVFTMFWYNEFFEIVKWPAKKAGLSVVEDRNRPVIFDYENWEKVKATAKTIQSLNDVQRDAFSARKSHRHHWRCPQRLLSPPWMQSPSRCAHTRKRCFSITPPSPWRQRSM